MALRRAKKIKQNIEMDELLVFGYSCKIFRDDERALYIDQGGHLIPWMGNNELKIDRYDGRGTISDLSQFEAPSGGFTQFSGLTSTERRVEIMCDEERYRALHTNEEEEILYKEEEMKRLEAALGEERGSYGEVSYNYEKSEEEIPDKGASSSTVEIDVPFVPSPLLDIPLNMQLPATMKQNAVIEKTAMFIASQGPQMEILLKMKQSNNRLFDFLSFDNSIHAYYRLVLNAIKSGRYKPASEEEKGGSAQNNGDKDGNHKYDEHYLHPSLAPLLTKIESAPSIPSISYRPSADCAYTMLVTKLKDKAGVSQIRQDNNYEPAVKSEDQPPVKAPVTSSRKSSVRCIVTPPEDLQAIIDKMASYVAKNGADFETIVQSKNDPRFDFLNSEHIYRVYYDAKLSQFRHHKGKFKQADTTISIGDEVDEQGNLDDESCKGKLAPVCFSIKSKETESIIEKSAFPVEESSEEEVESKKTEGVGQKLPKRKTEHQPENWNFKSRKVKKHLEKDRVKDKLTVAIREKIVNSYKEKQIKLERKKKVAAFLKSLSGSRQSSCRVGSPSCEDIDVDSDIASIPEIKAAPSPESNLLRRKRRRTSSESSEDKSRTSPETVTIDDSPVRTSHKTGGKSSRKYKKKKHKSRSHRKHSKQRKYKRYSSSDSD